MTSGLAELRRWVCRLGAVLLIGAITGCAWDSANQVGRGAFNRNLLQKGGLIVGGVSSRTEMLSGAQRRALGRLMEQAFESQYPDMYVVTSTQVRDALGRSMFAQMHDSYRFHGTGSAVFMNALAKEFPDARYVAFARIERDQINRRRLQLDSGGIELQTSRAIIVGMRLFDLHDRQTLVWAGALRSADANRRRLLNEIAGEAPDSLYPRPPAGEAVVDQVLGTLAASIGRGKDSS